jgi:hypothetical protein
MSNVFEQVRKKWMNSPFILYVFIISILTMLAGLFLFAEDARSSRDGFEMMEAYFGVVFGNWPITYWVISVVPQLAQVLFIFMFMMDYKKNWWALVAAAAFFLIDFITDVQDRSGGQLFPADSPEPVQLNLAIAVAASFTILFITVGSELFLSASIGVALAIYPDAKIQYRKLRGSRKKKRQAPRGQPQRQGGQGPSAPEGAGGRLPRMQLPDLGG